MGCPRMGPIAGREPTPDGQKVAEAARAPNDHGPAASEAGAAARALVLTGVQLHPSAQLGSARCRRLSARGRTLGPLPTILTVEQAQPEQHQVQRGQGFISRVAGAASALGIPPQRSLRQATRELESLAVT